MDRVRWGFNTRVVSCGLVSILYRFIIITVVERVPNPAREPSPYLLCAPTGRCVLGAWVCRQCAYTVTVRGCNVRWRGTVFPLLLCTSRVCYISDVRVRGPCVFTITVRGRSARLRGPPSSSLLPVCARVTFGFGCGRVIGPFPTSPPSQPEQCRDVYFGSEGCGMVSPLLPPCVLLPAASLPVSPKAPASQPACVLYWCAPVRELVCAVPPRRSCGCKETLDVSAGTLECMMQVAYAGHTY